MSTTNTDQTISVEDQKLTVDEFKALLDSPGWKREFSIEFACGEFRSEFVTGIDGESKEIDVPLTYGNAEVISTLGSIVIETVEGFTHDTFDPSTLELSAEGLDSPVIVTGVTVLDKDGDELSEFDLIELISASAERKFDFTSETEDFNQHFKKVCKSVEFDLDEASGADTYEFKPLNGPTITFSGESIGSETNKSFDNNVNWQSAYLFKTINDHYVAITEHSSIAGGCFNFKQVKACDTIEEVKEFFGDCDLSRAVLNDALEKPEPEAERER